MMLPISAMYASLCGLLVIVLALRVVQRRRQYRVGIGSGDQQKLEQAIRVHSNAMEYIPIALLLMAFYELNQGNVYLLHSLGMLLVVGRALHAQGLGSNPGISLGRFWGTAITWVVIIIFSVANLVGYFI